MRIIFYKWLVSLSSVRAVTHKVKHMHESLQKFGKNCCHCKQVAQLRFYCGCNFFGLVFLWVAVIAGAVSYSILLSLTEAVSLILSQQQEQDPTNLYISNLPVSMDEQELENMLKPFGHVISTRILRDANGVSRGVGFARWNPYSIYVYFLALFLCKCCLLHNSNTS